jgi:hypothetical protein
MPHSLYISFNYLENYWPYGSSLLQLFVPKNICRVMFEKREVSDFNQNYIVLANYIKTFQCQILLKFV